VSLRDHLPDPISVVAVAFAMVMVMSAALAGGFGPGIQDATEEAQPVGTGAALFSAPDGVFCFIDVTSGCGGDGGSEEVDDSYGDKQTKLNLASALVSQHHTADTYLTTVENFLADSQSIASMKAKTALVEAINNDSITNTSQMKEVTHEAIRDYYSTRERNLVTRFNQHTAQLNYTSTVDYGGGLIFGKIYSGHSWTDFRGVATDISNLTLSNGSKVGVNGIHFHVGENYPNKYGRIGNSDKTERTIEIRTNPISDESWPAEKNISQKTVLDVGRYDSLFNEIQNQPSDLISQYDDSFIDKVRTSIEAGEINTSDLVTPEMLASEWATAYNNTQASVYKWANIAALGLDSPDLANTSYMNVTYQRNGTNVTRKGMLFARTGPDGGYQVGQTYNASQFGGTFFVPAGQNTSMERIGSNWTLEGAQTRDGERVDTVRTRDYNYQTTNASKLQEQLTQLAELQKEIESREPLAGGGGGGGGGGSQMVFIAILAVVAAAVVVNNRAQQGGGRDGR